MSDTTRRQLPSSLSGGNSNSSATPELVLKQMITLQFNDGVETPPFRRRTSGYHDEQLHKSDLGGQDARLEPLSCLWECVRTIPHQGGICSFCKGRSATYLGVSEGVIQWTLYEQLKKVAKKAEGGPLEWVGMFGAAAGAKTTASLITYPPRGIFSIQGR